MDSCERFISSPIIPACCYPHFRFPWPIIPWPNFPWLNFPWPDFPWPFFPWPIFPRPFFPWAIFPWPFFPSIWPFFPTTILSGLSLAIISLVYSSAISKIVCPLRQVTKTAEQLSHENREAKGWGKKRQFLQRNLSPLTSHPVLSLIFVVSYYLLRCCYVLVESFHKR